MKESEFIRGKPTDVSGEQRLSFAFKLITIGIIVGGLQASAQKFAYSVGYDPGWVGEPVHVFSVIDRYFPIYPFWRLVIWTLMNYRKTQIHDLLYSAWMISIYTSIAAIVFYFFGSSDYMVEGKRSKFPRWKKMAFLNLSRFLNPHAMCLILWMLLFFASSMPFVTLSLIAFSIPQK